MRFINSALCTPCGIFQKSSWTSVKKNQRRSRTVGYFSFYKILWVRSKLLTLIKQNRRCDILPGHGWKPRCPGVFHILHFQGYILKPTINTKIETNYRRCFRCRSFLFPWFITPWIMLNTYHGRHATSVVVRVILVIRVKHINRETPLFLFLPDSSWFSRINYILYTSSTPNSAT